MIRFLILIGSIQFILLSVVLVKQFTLDEQLAEAKLLIAELPSPKPQTSSDKQAPQQSLSKAQMRVLISEELATFSDYQRQEAELDVASLADGGEMDEIQSQKLQELGNRIDYLLSDGEFSAADMQEFEDSLVTLQPELRQKLLNKLAKAMKEAKLGFLR